MLQTTIEMFEVYIQITGVHIKLV